MQRLACPPLCATLALVLAVLLPGGCAENSTMTNSRVSQLQQQQTIISRQNQQMKDRLQGLSQDNQQLVADVAQAQRQAKAAEDQLVAVKGQLRTVKTQLDNVRAEKQNREKQVQTLTASMRRRGGVSISPNSSLSQTLPTITPADGHARQDGDVVRVALFSDRLFEPGTARLRPGAAQLIGDVASQLMRTYPDNKVGVEGHTDNGPLVSRQYSDSHGLSLAQAMAVYHVLVGRTQYRQEHLFISGHGSNYPTHSNGSPQGKQQNRRIELVVYPDRVGK